MDTTNYVNCIPMEYYSDYSGNDLNKVLTAYIECRTAISKLRDVGGEVRKIKQAHENKPSLKYRVLITEAERKQVECIKKVSIANRLYHEAHANYNKKFDEANTQANKKANQKVTTEAIFRDIDEDLNNTDMIITDHEVIVRPEPGIEVLSCVESVHTVKEYCIIIFRSGYYHDRTYVKELMTSHLQCGNAIEELKMQNHKFCTQHDPESKKSLIECLNRVCKANKRYHEAHAKYNEAYDKAYKKAIKKPIPNEYIEKISKYIPPLISDNDNEDHIAKKRKIEDIRRKIDE